MGIRPDRHSCRSSTKKPGVTMAELIDYLRINDGKRWSGDPLDPNVGAAEIKAVSLGSYAAAIAVEPQPPSMFAFGDWPIFLASSLDVSILRRIPACQR